ncbi:MAG TPA: Na+:solute symporter [Bacteroidales bacterium]|nr:Na+:solute symporter [Bacteroidales bacterium]
MSLAFIDWIIIIAYLMLSLGIGWWFRRKAGRSTSDFFLSGRNLPWYIAGTSMVATTFAADTPLAVTELVSEKGIAGNWLWWNMLLGGMLTVFFFARLWRRAGILTDAEFVTLRYSGAPARFLRGFKAVYIGIAMNAIVIAWVNLAMVKILQVIFPSLTFFGLSEVSFAGMYFSSHLLWVGMLLMIVALYSSLSGLMGVSITDSLQFVLAMTGSIVLAVVAVREVGGLGGLREGLAGQPWVTDFWPTVNAQASQAGGVLRLSATALVAYLGVQWWASWYPGAEPGGGGYVAQRMMSAKDEKHSLLATLWFQVAHYALRPWPWILVALAGLIVYPHEADRGATYVMFIRDHLPAGLTGLLLAAFFAAYMSTIASQTVWGTSYIVNDLFRPYLRPGASETYYVKVSRLTTFLLILFSLVVTTQFNKISDAWRVVIVLSTGIGLVLMLRWFWWRVSAWSELAAMLAPYIIYPVLRYGFGLDPVGADFELSLLIIVGWSTLFWLVVTWLTPPTDDKTLEAFYRRIHAGGPGWKPLQRRHPEVQPDSGYGRLALSWAAGVAMVLMALFGVGKLLLLETTQGLLLLAGAALAAAVIINNMNRLGWKSF